MIKMFVFDLDGTLLKKDQSFDDHTVDMIKELQNDGKKIVIATGRNYTLSYYLAEKYDIQCDMIVNNGHEIRWPNETAYTPFDKDILLQVLAIFKKYDMHLTAYGENDTKYSFYDEDKYYNEHIFMSESMRGCSVEDKKDIPLFNRAYYAKNLIQMEEVGDFENINILKIDSKSLHTESNKRCIEELKEIPNIMIASACEEYVEVIQDNAHKASAVLELAKSYGITPDEICVFGDGENDIEMLEAVKYSFAMENAKDCVKQVAKYVTDTNNNQGVLKGLMQLREMGEI
ncbi:MAG: hypothetical protein ATN35_06640 [Epulopiscium sp. Nele67-Bin004]|nr:MAG: hypothetical protein ATN35_06640 [Epulopiscium sp. Nele67-Bin004]